MRVTEVTMLHKLYLTCLKRFSEMAVLFKSLKSDEPNKASLFNVNQLHQCVGI